MKYAHGLIADYLPANLGKQLATSLGFVCLSVSVFVSLHQWCDQDTVSQDQDQDWDSDCQHQDQESVLPDHRCWMDCTSTPSAKFYIYLCTYVGLQPKNHRNVEFCP